MLYRSAQNVGSVDLDLGIFPQLLVGPYSLVRLEVVLSAWLMRPFSSEVHRSSNQGIRRHGQPPARAPRPRPEPWPVCFQADRVQSQGGGC